MRTVRPFVWVEITVVVAFAAWLLLGGSTPAGHSAHLTLDFGTHKRAFEGAVAPGMTVFDALQASITAGGIDFDYTLTNDNSVEWLKVDGATTTDTSFAFEVNGTDVPVSDLARVPLYSGDEVHVTVDH